MLLVTAHVILNLEVVSNDGWLLPLLTMVLLPLLLLMVCDILYNNRIPAVYRIQDNNKLGQNKKELVLPCLLHLSLCIKVG